MNERMAFGLELRRIRERRGLSLEQMSEQTKVGVSHYAALEAGDLSRWPSGIFRRAFVRSYATAGGLDPDEVLAAFSRIFPDPSDGPRAAARIMAEAALREETLKAARESHDPLDELPVLRLALEPQHGERGFDWFRAAAPRIASALVDVCFALVPGALASVVFGPAWFLRTALVVGLLGHVVYFSATGATPGRWVISKLPREFTEKLTRVAARRRRPDTDEAAGPHRRFRRHSTSRPASHAHRVQH
jgi:transcriptional regulator with XRE-family HTH domain